MELGTKGSTGHQTIRQTKRWWNAEAGSDAAVAIVLLREVVRICGNDLAAPGIDSLEEPMQDSPDGKPETLNIRIKPEARSPIDRTVG
jgi:hypothetical protein